jgi:two-component sensor histidine kinase
LKEQPDSGAMSLTIRDDGVGFPKDFKLEKCKTMGLQVVQILIKQIEGEMTLIDRPHAVFTISFSRPK